MFLDLSIACPPANLLITIGFMYTDPARRMIGLCVEYLVVKRDHTDSPQLPLCSSVRIPSKIIESDSFIAV